MRIRPHHRQNIFAPTDAQIKKIIELKKDGLQIRLIAERFGFGYYTIRRIIREAKNGQIDTTS